MSAPVRQRGFLLALAAEGIAPTIAGCAGALAAGPIGGVAGVVVGQVVERAINFFGPRIVESWTSWLNGQPKSVQLSAIEQLAELTPSKARADASAALARLAPAEASPEDCALALEYLCAIPRAVQRSLVPDVQTGGLTLPSYQNPQDPHVLLRMLPTDAPPYPPHTPLPESPYLLGDLVGTGGFGVVYRATATSLQHLRFAIKFCLDRSMVALLRRERDNLERLIETAQERWSERIVRFYGYNLDHPTPFLVYEYVPGGDLTTLLTNMKQQTGRGLAPEEVLNLMKQLAEGLAFAHERGLVHRDLKPANVLVSGDTLKLADFGIGTVVAAHATQHSQIGHTALGQLRAHEQVTLYSGAGTPLYMSPEQRRGEPPDPRHDIYSFGVIWYQLLLGDVTRELHPGWARELTVKCQVPPEQIALLERCVGWIEDRPRNGKELLALLHPEREEHLPVHRVAFEEVPPEEIQATRKRKIMLLAQLRQLLADWGTYEHEERRARTLTVLDLLVGMALPAVMAILVFTTVHLYFLMLVGTVLGVACGVIAVWALLKRRQVHAERTRKILVQRAEKLAADYPEEIQSWGGSLTLRSPQLLKEMIEAMQLDNPVDLTASKEQAPS